MAVKATNSSYVREFVGESGKLLCSASVHIYNLPHEQEANFAALWDYFCGSIREIVNDAEAQAKADEINAKKQGAF